MCCSARSRTQKLSSPTVYNLADASAFVELVQLGKKGIDTAGIKSVVAPNRLAGAIQHDQRRETFDLISLRQFLVLSFGLNALRFAMREIDFQ